MPSILNTNQFKKDEIETILSRAFLMEKQCVANKINPLLKNKIVACVFFEPSTRTRLSFETAAFKLGAQVISAENAMENTSTHKGETIEDTVKILCSYADIIVIRHSQAGILDKVAKV